LWADHGDYALMGSRFGQQRQLLPRFLTHADTGLTAEGDKPVQSCILALAGYENMVKTPLAGLERFFDRMDAVENFHKG
jgi:hypothetical protein